MINEELRKNLPEEALVFDNPSYDHSIIGVSHDDRVIYDYDLMIQEYIAENECSEEDAIDFIDYNTIRSLSYFSQDQKPIILFKNIVEIYG